MIIFFPLLINHCFSFSTKKKINQAYPQIRNKGKEGILSHLLTYLILDLMEHTQPWCFIRRQLALANQKNQHFVYFKSFPLSNILLYGLYVVNNHLCQLKAFLGLKVYTSKTSPLPLLIGLLAMLHIPTRRRMWFLYQIIGEKKSITKSEGEIKNCL